MNKSLRNKFRNAMLSTCLMTVCQQSPAQYFGDNLLQGALDSSGSGAVSSFYARWTENYWDGYPVEEGFNRIARIVPYELGETVPLTFDDETCASVTFTSVMSAFREGEPVALLFVGTDDQIFNKFSYNYKFTVPEAGLYRLTGNAYIAKQMGYKTTNDNVMRRGVMAVVISNEIGNKSFEMTSQPDGPRYVESFAVYNKNGTEANSTYVDFRVGNNTDYAKPIKADFWLPEGDQYLSIYPPYYDYIDVPKSDSSKNYNNVFVLGNLGLNLVIPVSVTFPTNDQNEHGLSYYNLQGIRVSKPEKGLYIMYHNGRVSKIRL